MNKVTLKYTGNGYRGNDPGNNNAEIICMNGQDVAVSEAKAVQLLKDYPKNFSKAGDTAKAEPAKQAEPAAPKTETVVIPPAPESLTPPENGKPKPSKPAPKTKPAAKPKAKNKKR